MAKFYGIEKISKLVKLGTNACRLQSGSFVKLGGQAYDIGQLDLDTNILGVGGMEAPIVFNRTYYVYLVLISGNISLIATLNNTAPSVASTYRKVGAFSTELESTDIQEAYFFNDARDRKSTAKFLPTNTGTLGTVLSFPNLDTTKNYNFVFLHSIQWVGTTQAVNQCVLQYVDTTSIARSQLGGQHNNSNVVRSVGMDLTFTPTQTQVDVEMINANASLLRGSGNFNETHMVVTEFLDLDWSY